MKTKVGMWIDHREANIVFLWQDGEVMKQIKSNVEKQLRRSDDSPVDKPFEAQSAPAPDRREKGYTATCPSTTRKSCPLCAGAGSVFIFGPGEAKGEFRKHLEKHNLGGLITGFETADKMTRGEVARKVREFYLAATSSNEYGANTP
jgi:hypothetical protein